uniref:Uncharacterized protein n=1 Tax=Eiseniibacteriota bacterium TaxID=2212470 RepID=A0A832MIH0_UNCEI
MACVEQRLGVARRRLGGLVREAAQRRQRALGRPVAQVGERALERETGGLRRAGAGLEHGARLAGAPGVAQGARHAEPQVGAPARGRHAGERLRHARRGVALRRARREGVPRALRRRGAVRRLDRRVGGKVEQHVDGAARVARGARREQLLGEAPAQALAPLGAFGGGQRAQPDPGVAAAPLEAREVAREVGAVGARLRGAPQQLARGARVAGRGALEHADRPVLLHGARGPRLDRDLRHVAVPREAFEGEHQFAREQERVARRGALEAREAFGSRPVLPRDHAARELEDDARLVRRLGVEPLEQRARFGDAAPLAKRGRLAQAPDLRGIERRARAGRDRRGPRRGTDLERGLGGDGGRHGGGDEQRGERGGRGAGGARGGSAALGRDAVRRRAAPARRAARTGGPRRREGPAPHRRAPFSARR